MFQSDLISSVELTKLEKKTWQFHKNGCEEHSHKVFGSIGLRYEDMIHDMLIARDSYISSRK